MNGKIEFPRKRLSVVVAAFISLIVLADCAVSLEVIRGQACSRFVSSPLWGATISRPGPRAGLGQASRLAVSNHGLPCRLPPTNRWKEKSSWIYPYYDKRNNGLQSTNNNNNNLIPKEGSTENYPTNHSWKAAPAVVLSVIILFLLDILFRRFFELANISFPSNLAGCGFLLLSLFYADGMLLRHVQPGAALLAKWLPVFFVPSLITLPLSAGLGTFSEWIKVGFVVIAGFFFTLLTTSFSVVLVRKVFAPNHNKTKKKNSSSSPYNDNNQQQLFEKKENKTINETLTLSPGELLTPPSTDEAMDESATIMEPYISQESADKPEMHNNSEIDVEPANTVPEPIQPAKDLNQVNVQTASSLATKQKVVTNNAPFSDQTFYSLLTLSTTTYAAAMVSTMLSSPYSDLLTTTCFLFSTLCSFLYGTRLPASFTKWVHPLITCTAITWGSLGTFGLFTGRGSFRKMLRIYRTGHMMGAGDLLLFCLGPAVVSLAVSMYERRFLMRDNVVEVGAAIGTSTLGGVFGTAALVRFLEIGDPTIRLALLSRNITSPLAMAIAGILGADVSLAVSMVVITGLLGANFGALILTALGIRDPVARGLGVGAAAHGLGTAALVQEKDAFPFAAIAMALTACAATVTVSIPLFRRIILELALGY